jgi:hypothetical protein
MVCLRNISVDTLHKGDTDDDDDDDNKKLQMGCHLVAVVIMHLFYLFISTFHRSKLGYNNR